MVIHAFYIFITYYFSFNWCEKPGLCKIGMKRQFLDFSHSACIAVQTQIQIQSLNSWIFYLLLCEAQRTLSTEGQIYSSQHGTYVCTYFCQTFEQLGLRAFWYVRCCYASICKACLRIT